TVQRYGQQFNVTVMKRYRRFVQLVNGVQLRYFKEFGRPWDLNKETGKWVKKGERLGVQQRATELFHFIDIPDTLTPYGIPKWITQLPSVIGSRKAEELNLDFFEHGGVPPVLVILQGGVLAQETRKAMEQGLMKGMAKTKNQVKI